MTSATGFAAQAVEWKDNSPISSGVHTANLIHCIEDGDVTAHFESGDKTRSFVTGDDVTLANIKVTVVSGKFDIN